MKRIFILLVMLILPSVGFSQDIGNYLILNDIGEYKYRPKRTSEIYGNSGRDNGVRGIMGSNLHYSF